MRRPPRGFAGHGHRARGVLPLIAMDSRFAIEHLMARSKSFSDACDVDLGGFIAYGSLNRGLWPWSA